MAKKVLNNSYVQPSDLMKKPQLTKLINNRCNRKKYIQFNIHFSKLLCYRE